MSHTKAEVLITAAQDYYDDYVARNADAISTHRDRNGGTFPVVFLEMKEDGRRIELHNFRAGCTEISAQVARTNMRNH